MRLAFAVGCISLGIVFTACSDDDPESKPMTVAGAMSGRGQGGAGSSAAGSAGTPSAMADAGRAGTRPDGGGSSGVMTGNPDGGDAAGRDAGDATPSSHLIAHGGDGCVITTDGSLQCWDTIGTALGNTTTGSFVAIYGGPAETGEQRRCMLDAAGSYSCDNGAPRPIADFPVTDMAVGSSVSCGLQPDRTVLCWDDRSMLSSADLPVPSGAFVQIAAESKVFCALREDGTGACWNDAANEYTYPAGQRFVQLALGPRLACGVTGAGAVECWGPLAGQLAVPPPGSGVKSVQLGFAGGCALMEDGRAECFGNLPLPNEDPPGHRFRELAPGNDSTCGIATDDSVWCWQSGLSKQMTDPAGKALLAKRP